MSYTHLSREERYPIHALRRQGLSCARIAAELHRSVATITREIQRNSGLRGYKPAQKAHDKARARQCDRRNAQEMSAGQWRRVQAYLRLSLSPQGGRSAAWGGGFSHQPRNHLSTGLPGQARRRRFGQSFALPQGSPQALRQWPGQAWGEQGPGSALSSARPSSRQKAASATGRAIPSLEKATKARWSPWWSASRATRFAKGWTAGTARV